MQRVIIYFTCSFLFIIKYKSSYNNLEAVCLGMPNKMSFLMTFFEKIFNNVSKHHVVICISLRLVDIMYLFKISRPK